jgi:hypothetical protein
MVGMRFLRLLVRCLPSGDIPQAAKFFAGACFPELHPIANVETKRGERHECLARGAMWGADSLYFSLQRKHQFEFF